MRFCSYYILFICFFFFFSSRRRHTRCLSDWSSDVCSSDLAVLPVGPRRGGATAALAVGEQRRSELADARHVQARSEERRVGKECRSRWAAYDEKKKRKRRYIHMGHGMKGITEAKQKRIGRR